MPDNIFLIFQFKEIEFIRGEQHKKVADPMMHVWNCKMSKIKWKTPPSND